jgi:hypothetical protein
VTWGEGLVEREQREAADRRRPPPRTPAEQLQADEDRDRAWQLRGEHAIRREMDAAVARRFRRE